jgi:Uncharacterised nucleotidyltransferase
LQLLTYAAKDLPSRPADGVLPPLSELNNREIRWTLKGGLGPLLYRATAKQAEQVPVALRDQLVSADLSAQLRHAALVETTKEVIDVCRDQDTCVTLLKGISISEQCYPAAHLRPMGDVDILIPADEYESAEKALLRVGYTRARNFEPGEGSHHGVPLLDPRREVWVELHTALFPRREDVHCGRVFDTSLAVASTFHGRSVHRLTDELQLAYIAHSWIRDITLHGIHPSFLASLLDAIYLLKASRKELAWQSLLDRLDTDMTTASLHVMLCYLVRHGLAEGIAPIVASLTARQEMVGPLQLWLIYKTLDLFLLGGRPLSHALRPPVPGRYSLRYQLRKRQ